MSLPTIFVRNSPTFPSILKRQLQFQHLPKQQIKSTNTRVCYRGFSHLSTSTSTNRQSLCSQTAVPYPFVRLGSKRTMSSTTPAKKEFLVIVPDKKGVLAKRNEVRDQHLTNVKPLVEAGTVSVGGALMDAHPEDGEAPQMNGSMLVVSAESLEKARELIAKDIYTTHGVWDIENAQIMPVRLLPKELWARQR